MFQRFWLNIHQILICDFFKLIQILQAQEKLWVQHRLSADI